MQAIIYKKNTFFAVCFLLFFCSISVFSQSSVDFIRCNADVFPNATTKSITGKVRYEVIVSNKKDTLYIDAENMQFSNVKINNRKAVYKNSGKQLIVFKKLKKGKNILTFNYKATPKQTLYFIGNNTNLQIWTQGQGKNTSHWLPSFNNVNEKVIFTISVTYFNDFTVLSNGILATKTTVADTTTWQYTMEKPMASYLVMLAIGKFVQQKEQTENGTELEYYLLEKDKNKFEPTYRNTKKIVGFLEQEIGVPYPWKIYRQIPIHDFLYAGMENTTSTLFSQEFVVDSIGYNDKKYLNVNAHELAHQWFGNLITATKSKHHWLQEGFATYYALLAEQAIFGSDYFNYQLWQMATQLNKAQKNDTIPLLNEKASALTFYKKGAWALHALRSEIGEVNFKKAVQNYLLKNAYKNVNTAVFLEEIKKVAPYFSIDSFKNEWLLSSKFNYKKAITYLKGNTCITTLQKIINLRNTPYSEKEEYFKQIMQSDSYFPVKQEILYQCETIPFTEKEQLMYLALQTKHIKVRQALAQTLHHIPLSFKKEAEMLLQDNSYITKEIMLFKLWKNFPKEERKYRTMSRNWIGLNHNLKIAYLTLQLVAKNATKLEKEQAIKALEKLTQEPYNATIRMTAIETLLTLKIETNQVLKSILNATLHHRWQMVVFGKKILRPMLADDTKKQAFLRLKNNLTKQQQKRLNYFLKEME